MGKAQKGVVVAVLLIVAVHIEFSLLFFYLLLLNTLYLVVVKNPEGYH